MADMPMVVQNVRVVGPNGQVMLGKEFAGRHVLVEAPEPGVWLIRTATIIPDNERWLHQPQAARDVKRALDWARANPAAATDFDALLAKLNEKT